MRYCAATVFTPVFATLLFTSFSTIPLSASQCEAARVMCGPGATGERMGFAVEMYFDEKTEKALRDLRKVLSDAGVRPVLDEMGDRPHISLAVFSQVDVNVLLEELEGFAAETRPLPITLSAIFAASPTLPTHTASSCCFRRRLRRSARVTIRTDVSSILGLKLARSTAVPRA